MTYKEAHEYLDSLLVFGIKLGLENMKALCELLGNPENDLKFVHVAGTNGKGSTCSMLAAALKNCSLKTAFYSSPFLYRFTERWRINGLEVSEDDVALAIGEIALLEPELSKITGVRPTYFEVLTAAALLIFKKAKVDVVVWETGMGGRLDATNVVTPLLSIITNIELDHTQYLGETIREIALEKGGIVKPGVPFISGDLKQEVCDYFESISVERGSPVYFRNKDFSVETSNVIQEDNKVFRKVIYKSAQKTVEVNIPTIGLYQCDNAANAIAALELLVDLLGISFEDAMKGLESFVWPGRMEVQSSGLILDGAHNPVGAKALVDTLGELDSDKNYNFICGILSDKNWQEVLDILAAKANSYFFVEVANERSSKASELSKYAEEKNIKVLGVGSVKDALCKMERPENTVIVGSLYLIGEALQILNDGEQVKIDLL